MDFDMSGFACDPNEWPEWSEIWDPSSGAYYYYNNYTHESVWEKPKNFVPTKTQGTTENDGKTIHLYPPYMRSVIKIQSTFRSKKARAKSRKARASKLASENESSNVWTVATDPQTGYEYYYNTQTEECSWEKPKELLDLESSDKQLDSLKKESEAVQDTLPEWVEVYDPSSNAYYFYNNFSGESTWEKPESYKKPNSLDAAKLMSPELRGALLIQCTFRAKKARGDLRKQRGAQLAKEKDVESMTVWSPVLDPASNCYYYYNSETGECTWEVPEELSKSEAKKAQSEKDTIQPVTTTDKNSEENSSHSAKKDEDLKTAAINIQLMWRVKRAKKNMLIQRGKQKKQSNDNRNILPWRKVNDPQSGYDYFYNEETEEVSWELPVDVKEVEEEISPEKKRECAAIKIQSILRKYLEVKRYEVKRVPLDFFKRHWCALHVSLLQCEKVENTKQKLSLDKFKITCALFDEENPCLRKDHGQNNKVNICFGNPERGVLPIDVLRVEQDDIKFTMKFADFFSSLMREYTDDASLLKPSPSHDISIFNGSETTPDAWKLKLRLKIVWGLQEACDWLKVRSENNEILFLNISKNQCFKKKPENETLIGGVTVPEDIIQKAIKRYEEARELEQVEYRNKLDHKRSQLLEFTNENERNRLVLEVKKVSAAELSTYISEMRLNAFSVLLQKDTALLNHDKTVAEESINSCKSLLRASFSRCRSGMKQISLCKGTGSAEEFVSSATEESCAAEAQLVVTANSLYNIFKELLIGNIEKLKSVIVLMDNADVSLPIHLSFQLRNIQKISEVILQDFKCTEKSISAFVTAASQMSRYERLMKILKKKGGVYKEWTETFDEYSGLYIFNCQDKSKACNQIAPWDRPVEIWRRDTSMMLEIEDGGGDTIENMIESKTPVSRNAATVRWWQTILVIAHKCSRVSIKIVQFVTELNELINRRKKERDERHELAEKANKLADEHRNEKKMYEKQCRERFLQICQERWKEGVEQRRKEMEERLEKHVVEKAVKKTIQGNINADSLRYRTPFDAIKSNCTIEEFVEAIEDARKRREYQEKNIFCIDRPDPETGEVLLHTACWHGRRDIVEYLLQLGSDITTTVSNLDKTTGLHIAVKAGDFDMIKCLIERGAKLDTVDTNGDTVLHIACRLGSISTIKVLLHPDSERKDGNAFWRMIGCRNNKGRLASQVIYCHRAIEIKSYKNWIKHRISAMLWAYEEKAKSQPFEDHNLAIENEYTEKVRREDKKQKKIKKGGYKPKKKIRGRKSSGLNLKPISWSVQD